MKNIIAAIAVLVPLALAGCSSKTGSAGLGALGGAAAGGGAYEYRLNQEMQRIEDDLEAKKIDQKEYEIRKDQIQRLSVFR